MTPGKRRFIRLLAAGMRWVDGRWFLPAEAIRNTTQPFHTLRVSRREAAVHLYGYWVWP